MLTSLQARAGSTAWEANDVDALISLLDPDATATADGGGLAVTHLHPIVGSEHIARAYAESARGAVRNPEKLRPWQDQLRSDPRHRSDRIVASTSPP
ncbi:hypothetical protein [Streptomyces sp. NPDC003015]